MATALFRSKPADGKKRLQRAQASSLGLGDKESPQSNLQEEYRQHSALLKGSFELARLHSSQDMDDMMRRFQAVIGVDGDASHKTAPRASEAAISSLPHARVLRPHKKLFANDESACGVCCGRLIDGAALTRLPCGHVFHINCSTSWLSKSCTCPECRYELATNDVLYEKTRIVRMKDRATITCKCHPSGMHSCFFADPSKTLLNQLDSCNTPSDSLVPMEGKETEQGLSDFSSRDFEEPSSEMFFF